MILVHNFILIIFFSNIYPVKNSSSSTAYLFEEADKNYSYLIMLIKFESIF